MKNNLLFYAFCMVLLGFTHANAQPESVVKEGEAWVQQVEDSLGKTFGDLNRRQIGPGGGVSSGSDGKDGNGPNVVVGGGTGTGGGNADKHDPSKLDPNDPDIAALIRQWLAVAEPPKNAEGAKFRYTKWGSWEGQGIGGKTVRVGRPEAAEGMTPVVYVWSIRAKLDSIDHCLLEEYVLAKLANKNIDHCHGRYKKPQGIQVANVVGLPGEKAKAILKGLGLDSTFSMGKSATSKAQAFTVARQDHTPSKRVAPGTVVKLTLYDDFKSLLKVPSVVGLPSTAARNQLVAAGFTVEVKPVGKATEAKNAFTVKNTTPLANAEVKQGSLVVINTYGSFDDSIIMPNVIGLSWFDAKKKLESMGINSRSKKGGKAPREELTNIVTKQSPEHGITVTSRTKVKITYYGEYRKNQQQLVADMKCPVPNSEAFWNQAKNAPDCKCSSGFSTAKDGKSCQDDFRFDTSFPTEGIYTTTYGDMNFFKSGRLAAKYKSDSGRLMGAFRGSTLEGYWIEKSSQRRCSTQKDGSYYWGKIAYTFSSDYNEFKGKWSYCGNPLNTSWTGKRKSPPKNDPLPVNDDPVGNLACLCKGGDAYNRNDKTCDSPYSPANVMGGESDTAYPSGSYPFTNECSYPIKSGKKNLPPIDKEPPVETDGTMQVGVNFKGSDFKNFLLDQAQPGLCSDACEKNERCQAWTFVKPGIQGSKAKCWLKYSIPKPLKDVCCISGITQEALNGAAAAKVAAKACVNANIESGRDWAFQANLGYSHYYQHSGHLCEKSGARVMKILEDGKKLMGFTCSRKWQSCKRDKTYDADIIFPAKDYKWGKLWYLKLKMKWRGMNERELYIAK